MDAHPNMVIAHEFLLMHKLVTHPKAITDKTHLFNAIYRDSYNDAMKGWRSSEYGKKGYDLSLGMSWQGRFKKPLKVIGDKSGGSTAREHSQHPLKVETAYRVLKQKVRIPIHVIHVVRNPYDMIATTVLYEASDVHGRKVDATVDHKHNSSARALHFTTTDTYLRKAKSVRIMTDKLKLNILDVHIEDHIRDPKGTMQRICDFLDVECSKEYLQDCYDKTFKSVSRTRDLVTWTEEALKLVENELIKPFPFFQRYSFESDY